MKIVFHAVDTRSCTLRQNRCFDLAMLVMTHEVQFELGRPRETDQVRVREPEQHLIELGLFLLGNPKRKIGRG